MLVTVRFTFHMDKMRSSRFLFFHNANALLEQQRTARKTRT